MGAEAAMTLAISCMQAEAAICAGGEEHVRGRLRLPLRGSSSSSLSDPAPTKTSSPEAGLTTVAGAGLEAEAAAGAYAGGGAWAAAGSSPADGGALPAEELFAIASRPR